MGEGVKQHEKANPSTVNGASSKPPDAGMRHLDHYAARLPKWRYRMRQALIPIVRAETPYLAAIQANLRTSLLDRYFALAANLGTHTFFMVMLPILFWCGYTELGRAAVHLLALGVVLSGIMKDLLCLPRPLSPPLHRITMSGSAALEYGFPSTHSTNAVSVAAYILWMLHGADDMDANTKLACQILCYVYGFSIMFGRIYCGMHGFIDVVVGTCLGGFIAFLQIVYGHDMDMWISSNGIWNPLIVLLVILVVIRTHPEPADDCPCFDDSVAFSGVFFGIEVSTWHFSTTFFSTNTPIPGTTHFVMADIGMARTIARIVIGVLLVFLWRGLAKPILLDVLPPIFRIVEQGGIDLPRRFFLKASEYSSVPTLRQDDNVIPSAADIPGLLSNVRQRRGRAVSIGPQSAADAYETIAYRNEQRRRDSMSDGRRSMSPPATIIETKHDDSKEIDQHSLFSAAITDDDDTSPEAIKARSLAAEHERREIFRGVERPRVRYDVEVVTKLIVYTGIAILAVEVGPITFELLGLGMGTVKINL